MAWIDGCYTFFLFTFKTLLRKATHNNYFIEQTHVPPACNHLFTFKMNKELFCNQRQRTRPPPRELIEDLY